MARLKEVFEKDLRSQLKQNLSLENAMEVPRLTKVVINMSVADSLNDSKLLKLAAEQLGLIAGQKPVITRAKKSIAGFKLREGVPIGCKVTLRSDVMYEFIDRLVNVALPRVRDFRGLSPKSFDGKGNYNFGIKEQTIFPEISYDKVVKNFGMDVCICTSAKTNDQAKELLKLFNFPFSY